jgi:hypothetical protein
MDVTDTRPVIVLVTAETCSHCHTFKSNVWTKLRPVLDTSRRFRVVEINLPTTDAKPGRQYPRDLERFLRWFPILFMVSGSSWNEASREGSMSSLDAVVFNGRIDEGRVSHQAGASPTKENILSWLERELKLPPVPSGPMVGQGPLGQALIGGRPRVMLTNDGQPLQQPQTQDVVPTMGTVCSMRYRGRNAY